MYSYKHNIQHFAIIPVLLVLINNRLSHPLVFPHVSFFFRKQSLTTIRKLFRATFARQSRRYNPDIPQHQYVLEVGGGGGGSPCWQWAFGTLTARSRLTGGIPTLIQNINIYGFVNTILSQIMTSISIKLHRVYKCQLANMN